MNTNIKKILELGVMLSPMPEAYTIWEGWVHELEQALASPPEPTLGVKNAQRKWELVSAYQKTVRRGDLALALRLVSAMASLPDECQYMWRRVCTTAAEDIGAGNPLAMKFVLACAQVYTPSQLQGRMSLAVWTVLTRIMCFSPKSRLYCQFSIMENALKSKDMEYKVFDQTPYGQRMAETLNTDLQTIEHTDETRWLLKANWRAEGMAVGPIFSRLHKVILKTVGDDLTGFQTLKGLPEYCYDMHTRVGKGSLYKACGVLAVSQFFHQNPVKSKPEALGWALFFEEGGKIEHRWGNARVDAFEQQVVAERHGLGLEQWLEFRTVVQTMLSTGRFTEIRDGVLRQQEY